MLNDVYTLMSNKKAQTQYLDPTTGQYYTEQVYTPPANPYFAIGNNGGGINNNYSPYGMTSYGNSMINAPRTIRKNTGDISQVWKTMQNRQPYEYNVPSIESMFPLMTMPTMGNFQPSAYTGGAGQFLGGLLGNAPMATNNAAPAPSSGAGRFA